MNDVPRESPRTILFQFVIFPLGVVMIGVAIFLLFGKLASNEQSIPDYLNDIKSGSSHRKFQAAYELSKSIKRGEAKRYPNLVDQVIDIYRSSKDDDPRVRQYLTLVLGKIGDARAVPVLVDALRDPVVETRIYALIALAELRDRSSVPAVIAATRDEDKDVRKTAIYALGDIGDPRAVPILEEALNDQVADIRFNAAMALSRFGDQKAEPVLRAMVDRATLDRVPGMRPDQKEDAMVAAIPAYAKLAGKSAAAELVPLANSDPSMRVRAAAKDALK
ncbi:MAG TPA: HEAT repeat domain-containing protein [Thermoanaerobaculia bacterium]